ncbi:MAG: squalene/phytoene synthase family protein [Verrucomicrobiales bacterium]|nr:squalene/phytoene synthase family protein [Verrucomicrobiales bacterium]
MIRQTDPVDSYLIITSTTETADEIVRRSGSNLAFALAVLPKEKRRDMRVFYGFCRVIDDIADDPGFSTSDRAEGLDHWRALINGDAQPESGIETEFSQLIDRRKLPREMLLEIIAGCESDLNPQAFETFEDLQTYCFRVASAVGLVSIELFGYRNPETKIYAEQLGYALQLTNILRDVAEDAGEERIYLPLEDLARFGVKPESILEFSPEQPAFRQLMQFEADRAAGFYKAALAVLPEEDRDSMRSAELMRVIYSRILDRMQEDGFNVFEKRYRLSKLRMLWEFLRVRFF